MTFQFFDKESREICTCKIRYRRKQINIIFLNDDEVVYFFVIPHLVVHLGQFRVVGLPGKIKFPNLTAELPPFWKDDL